MTGRMNLKTLVRIRFGPEDEELLKPLTILAISASETGSNAIDLGQGGHRYDLKSGREEERLTELRL